MSCTVQNIDASEFMLREGLAELADYAKGKSLHDATASAMRRHLGLWAEKP
jgi:endonuclease YncB( thermonuclease family)